MLANHEFHRPTVARMGAARKIEALSICRLLLTKVRKSAAMDKIDYKAILEELPDELPDELGSPATREQIEELLSSNWMSDSTGIAGHSDDRSVNDNTGTSRVLEESGPPNLQTSLSAALPQASQARVGIPGLSGTKVEFLRAIYEMSKRDPERNPEGIVSRDDIRQSYPQLEAIIKSGKQGALHALVRNHGLIMYLKDIDPALKAKYRLTPKGLSLCQSRFD